MDPGSSLRDEEAFCCGNMRRKSARIENPVGFVSFSHTSVTNHAKMLKVAGIEHGKKYGYSSKNASPKTSGYFLAGLAKEPPRIGLGTGDRIVSRDLKEM